MAAIDTIACYRRYFVQVVLWYERVDCLEQGHGLWSLPCTPTQAGAGTESRKRGIFSADCQQGALREPSSTRVKGRIRRSVPFDSALAPRRAGGGANALPWNPDLHPAAVRVVHCCTLYFTPVACIRQERLSLDLSCCRSAPQQIFLSFPQPRRLVFLSCFIAIEPRGGIRTDAPFA